MRFSALRTGSCRKDETVTDLHMTVVRILQRLENGITHTALQNTRVTAASRSYSTVYLSHPAAYILRQAVLPQFAILGLTMPDVNFHEAEVYSAEWRCFFAE